MHRDEYLCNIYNIKNTLVGYCKYYTGDFIIEPHVVYIEFINITYEYRRRGYGTKLVKELMSKYELKWDNRFSEDGKKWYKCNYVDDKREGEYIEYYGNGNISNKCNYRNGQIVE